MSDTNQPKRDWLAQADRQLAEAGRLLREVDAAAERAGIDLSRDREERERIGGPECSFCGKSAKDVPAFVYGPGVYICSECVELCVELVQEQIANRAHGPDAHGPDAHGPDAHGPDAHGNPTGPAS